MVASCFRDFVVQSLLFLRLTSRGFSDTMSNVTSEKLQQLFKLLEREPNDTFLLYGVGMEYKKLGAPDKAIEHFDRVLKTDPNYCYAYYQKGQVLEQSGQPELAR